MNKNCQCLSHEDHKKYHEIMDRVWDRLPANIHDMIHSLIVQKKAVMEQISEWADENNEPDLKRIADLKIEKAACKLKDSN